MPAKAKVSDQIHAILGTDESEVKRVAKELAAQLSPGGDFGSEIIDGAAGNSDDAAGRIHQTIEALLTFPFFGGGKLVWLKNANFLADNQMGKSNAVAEALEKLSETLAGGLPASTNFLLSATEIDKRRTFYKGLSKIANVQVYDKLDSSKTGWEEEAEILVRQLADGSGLRFETEALECFTLFTGGDRRIIVNELEKLSLYIGASGRAVTADEVRLLVPMSRVGIIWELGAAISERKVPRALDLLEQLLFQGESAIGILLVAIIPTVRSLLLVKDLMQRHRLSRPQQPFFFGKTLEKLPPEATEHLPRKKDGTVNTFALGAAAVHAHRHELPSLRKSLEACLAANVQLVTSGLDPKIALSQLIVQVAS